ncbi:uncharacterized protein LOC111598036 [Drosophila hydei]|uniref:Uncharacterized protein LOC111598036 n=1 Tax=Drosophila hydei TaxID=7224 RepID=A0A6J1LRH2_DROHY|nr:uncharacterized protein LOC111598036 [Drosophila hydei]
MSAESTEHEETNVELVKLRRSSRIRLNQERKRLMSEEQQQSAKGKIKRMKTLYARHLNMCMAKRAEEQVEQLEQDIEAADYGEETKDCEEQLQKEENIDQVLETISQELLLSSQQADNGNRRLGFSYCVCADLNGQLFKLYDLPDKFEFLIPKNSNTNGNSHI